MGHSVVELVFTERCRLAIDGHTEISGVGVGKRTKMFSTVQPTERQQENLLLWMMKEIDFVIENG